MEADRSPLDALFWREEILQVLFWLQGEQLASSVRVEDLLALLQGTPDTLRHHLDAGVREGLLVAHLDDGVTRYALSEHGRAQAARVFHDAFADMQKKGHGECDADCDCNGDPSACAAHHHRH